MFQFHEKYTHKSGVVFRDVYVITEGGQAVVVTHSMAEAIEFTRG